MATSISGVFSNKNKKDTTTTSTTSGSKTTSSGTKTNTGTTAWDANTDYSKLMSEAAAKGDYKAAAQYEQLRNQKIDGTGSSYAKTNQYSGWLDTNDYSARGTAQMAQGASASDILATINARYNKAANTVGLQQYANDDLQQAMWKYYQNALANEAQSAADAYIDNFQYDEEKPTYESHYNLAIEKLLNQILTRDDFSYDAQNDPLYQQYAALYQREGDRAMRDTLAEAAASAGGMNSYAITAAQQANNAYNAQLNDIIPELYQLKYQMYLQDKESMVEDLGLLQGMDDRQYNRYRDTMSDWYNDKNFAYGIYSDAVQQGNWQQSFDYNSAVNDRNFNYQSAQDALDRDQWSKEWNNTLNQQAISNSRYDAEIKREDEQRAKEDAQSQAFALLELGQMPPAALLQAAGIDEAYATAYLTGIKQQMASKSSSKSSGGGDDKPPSPKDDDYKSAEWKEADKKVRETGDVTYAYNYNDGTAIGLGIGPVDNDILEKLALAGAIEGDEDGNLFWADGWSANNYRERLEMLSGWSNSLTLPGFSM